MFRVNDDELDNHNQVSGMLSHITGGRIESVSQQIEIYSVGRYSQRRYLQRNRLVDPDEQ
jgi:hypothetical protein